MTEESLRANLEKRFAEMPPLTEAQWRRIAEVLQS